MKVLGEIETDQSGQWYSPACLALLYFGLGELEKVEKSMQKALLSRDPILRIAGIEPSWDKYRNQPIAQKVFRQMAVLP